MLKLSQQGGQLMTLFKLSGWGNMSENVLEIMSDSFLEIAAFMPHSLIKNNNLNYAQEHTELLF